MPQLDCGIDIGSTNIKVVFTGDDGRVRHTLAVSAPRVDDEFGRVTDAASLVATLEGLIVQGWREVGTGHPLRSICAAGIGEDGLGVTKVLQPTGPAIPWFDRRASQEAQTLASQYDGYARRTGHRMDATRTAAKWLWLSQHRPAELAGARYWIALADYPAVWWSGKAFMSSSLAPRTACYDVYQRHWIDDILRAVRAPQLPPVLHAGQIVGGVRNGALRESGAASAETLVVAGGHDHPVAATVIRRLDGRARVDSMGTANLIYGETPNPQKPPTSGLSYSVPPSGNPGVACLGVLELSAMLAAAQADAQSFRAFLDHARVPGNPTQSVAELQEQSSDTIRSMRHGLERASLLAKLLVEEMDQAGVSPGPVFTTGGWSRSRAFVELRASVLGQPIHALGDLELTATGAALFGAEAATGRSISPLRSDDVLIVDPVPDWVSAYAEVYDSLHRSTTALG